MECEVVGSSSPNPNPDPDPNPNPNPNPDLVWLYVLEVTPQLTRVRYADRHSKTYLTLTLTPTLSPDQDPNLKPSSIQCQLAG